jgi:branched-chain amino acid aminotransferase
MDAPFDKSESLYVKDNRILKVTKFDPSVLAGYKTIYEVIRVRQSVPIFIDTHLRRMVGSISLSNLPMVHIDRINSSIALLLKENPVGEKNIKVSLTYKTPDDQQPILLVYFIPSKYPSGEDVKNGVRVITFNATRSLPNIKAENASLRVEADRIIRGGNCYEVLLVDGDGLITEGSRSNVFFVKGDNLFTAPLSRVLGGVTRQKVSEICAQLRIAIVEQCVNISEIGHYDCAFITGTSPGVLPIRSIDGINYNVNNPLMRRVMAEYNGLVELEVRSQKIN